LSTLVQQLISILAQHGGLGAEEAYAPLCVTGPFRNIDRPTFAQLLDGLRERALIELTADGTILLGERGEHLIAHHNFYAAFHTPDEYRLVNRHTTLGTLPTGQPYTEGMYLTFAGRPWLIQHIDTDHKVIDVTTAPVGVIPSFPGETPLVHTRVRQTMLEVMRSEEQPPYLDPIAQDLLREARDNFRRLGLHERPVVGLPNETILFTWAGDRTVTTLNLALQHRGLRVAYDGHALIISACAEHELVEHLGELANAGLPSDEELVASVPAKYFNKYDWALTPSLLNRSFANTFLDRLECEQLIAHLTTTAIDNNR
jgi:ATP-dependent Lhr-like helicase